MNRIRFTIGILLVIILLVGVGFAALRKSSDLWDSGLFSLTLTVMLISMLLAILRTEKRRAFWLGFALFGWIFLGLSLVPSIESRLITSKALDFLDSKVSGESIVEGIFGWNASSSTTTPSNLIFNLETNSQPIALTVNNGNGNFVDLTAVAGLVGSSNTSQNFARIGQSLLTMIAAFLGGLLSRHLHAKEREPDSRHRIRFFVSGS